MHRLRRKLPPHHYAHHFHNHPHPAPVPRIAQNHAFVLVSHLKMQVSQRQKSEVRNIFGLQLFKERSALP